MGPPSSMDKYGSTSAFALIGLEEKPWCQHLARIQCHVQSLEYRAGALAPLVHGRFVSAKVVDISGCAMPGELISNGTQPVLVAGYTSGREALLYFDHVHLQEVRDEHIQKVLQASGRQGAEQQMLYDVLWREHELSQAAFGGSQLVLGSAAALRHLAVATVRSEEMPMEEEALRQLLQSEAWSTVILADGLLTASAWSSTPDAMALPGACRAPAARLQHPAERGTGGVVGCDVSGEQADVAVLNRAMLLTKVLLSAAKPQVIAKMGAKAPLLVFPTWTSQPLASEDAAQRRAGLPDHSGLWGFARAVRMEYPGWELAVPACGQPSSRLKGSLPHDQPQPGVAAQEVSAWSQLAEALPSLGSAEELALRGQELARSAVKYTGALRLNMPARGSLTGLRCVPQADTAKTTTPAPNAVQLRIRAVGLNFRDVLNVPWPRIVEVGH
eukprot:Skav203402  [mRNA]  locus=scaffold1743:75014:89075:- [translate_table: standard]